MQLSELNDRWRTTGKPHAITIADNDDRYHWFCPACEGLGRTGVPLMTAMNDALLHKSRCPAFSGSELC